MISQSELKYYSSLLVKKFRVKDKKFIVEGLKIVEEGLASDYNCEAVFTTTAFEDSFPELINKIKLKARKIIQLKSIEYKKISDTRSPQGIAAVFNKSCPQKKLDEQKDKLILLIDNISDPGNLGTILRTCDWFGIKTVLISDQSVEYLNPKVLRASMGSIFNLDIYENVNTNELKDLKSNGYKVVCSDLNGKDIFKYQLNNKSIFTFSNESLGPSEIIKNMADDFVTIPRKGKAESLNVSSAAAIILANLTK
jgi:TrmH family RNA methyltransferase